MQRVAVGALSSVSMGVARVIRRRGHLLLGQERLLRVLTGAFLASLLGTLATWAFLTAHATVGIRYTPTEHGARLVVRRSTSMLLLAPIVLAPIRLPLIQGHSVLLTLRPCRSS